MEKANRIIDLPNNIKVKRVLIFNKSDQKVAFQVDVKNNGDLYLSFVSVGVKDGM